MTSRGTFFSLVMAVILYAITLVGCSSDQKSPITAPVSEERAVESDSLQTAGYGTQWPYYSQGYRNYLLLNVGYGDIGASGGQCKAWVQNLVKKVTDSRVIVPLNMTNYGYDRYRWYPDPYGHISGQSMAIENVQPGQVVQMAWGSSELHTFIMASKSSSTMYWLDSNWSKDGIVKYHPMTYANFKSLPNLRYSVYTIGW